MPTLRQCWPPLTPPWSPFSTKYNAEIDKAINQFGRGGLPVYVVYPADGGAPVLLPQLLTPGIVTAALEKAAKTGS